jgi:hypothetical protein
MEKIFNVMLLIGVLYALYLCIQKYNLTCDSDKKPNTKPKIKQELNKELNKELNEEFVNLDKFMYIDKEPTNKVKFNYEQIRPIDNKFLKEQDIGAQLCTWYPNTWIERIDENGEPVYNSRENVTGVKEDFIESKARFTYEFNSPRTIQMDGIADPDDFKDGKERTLKEVYDNSFIDYKKIIPKKRMIEIDPEQLNTKLAGSNLSFISPDNWIYDQEKPENGGNFDNGLMANDPFASNSIGNSVAVIDY